MQRLPVAARPLCPATRTAHLPPVPARWGRDPGGTRRANNRTIRKDSLLYLCGTSWSACLVPMATSEVKRGKAYTAPKGRPTVHRSGQAQGRRLPSTVQWGLAILAFLVVLGVIFYFGRGFRSAGGGGHSGLPADAPIAVLVDIDPLSATLGAV